ncbi:MAG: response regulator, partial [Thermoanaerobaculia bacterium]
MAPLALLVDDEVGILETLSGVLSDEGYETISTTSGEEAVELYLTRRPDVVFLDVWLPDRDGLETLALLRERDPQAAVVMLSGHGTTATAVRAIRMGAFDYLEKPPSYEQVVTAARGALETRRVALERGPLVYCAEGVDHAGSALDLVVPDDARLSVERRPELLGG